MSLIGEVLLLVPSLDVRAWKGLGRYSLYIYENLKDKFNIDVIELHKPRKNYAKAIFKSISLGSFSKYKLVHSVTPELISFKIFKYSKKIVTYHDFIPFLESSISNELKSLLLFLYRLNSKITDLIISNSSLTANQIYKFFGKESKIIHPPVDHKIFRFKKKVPKGKIILSFVSNFSFRKRVDIAIRVCSFLQKYVDCKLILAGGKLRESLQEHFDVNFLLKKYGVRDFEILEEVDDKTLVRIYRSSHFFIFPSMMEGFGIPIIEAQACGTPVLTIKSSLIPEEVKKFTLQCNDESDMVKKILNLVDNKEKYVYIQKIGFLHSKQFSVKKFRENYIRIYELFL